MSARQTIIPVFVPHVGCPNDCIFCNQRRISGVVRPVTPDEVSCAIEQGAAITPEGVQRQLAFYGGSFTAIPVKAQELLLGAAQPYLRSGVLYSIRLSTRPDAIDEETLHRLKKYGVETIELGAQSMDDAVLLHSGRGHTAEHVVQASRLIRQHGFKLILQMMTGLPGDENGKASLLTARRLAELQPDGVRIYPTVIVRDTALYDLWMAGKYEEHTVEKAIEICAELMPIFESAGIPVIRLGLNPTEDLSGGDAAGGAYHPALGELVKSRVMRNRAEALFAGVAPGSSVVLLVGKGKTSQMVGQHRGNISALKEKFSLKEIKVQEMPDKSDEIFLKFIAK